MGPLSTTVVPSSRSAALQPTLASVSVETKQRKEHFPTVINRYLTFFRLFLIIQNSRKSKTFQALSSLHQSLKNKAKKCLCTSPLILNHIIEKGEEGKPAVIVIIFVRL